MAVYSIPAGESFVDALARQLLSEHALDPLRLSDSVVMLPTRRACRALREAFLRAADGRPLLLPRLRPLGEIPDDAIAFQGESDLALPPSVPPLRRQFLLARLVQGLGDRRGGQVPSPEQAIRLAAELADLLDQAQIEGLDFAGLGDLVPADYADHWQITLTFLNVLTDAWPRLLTDQGWMDAALRRNRLIESQAAAWEAHPPPYPVIAAGSTGSIPAVARLLTVVAGLPNGRLVLPGLDGAMGDEDRAALDETHPQWGLMRLLDRLDMAPSAVPLWPGSVEHRRAWLAAEALRPATRTESWQALAGQGVDVSDDGPLLAGVRRVDCPGPREEAAVVALMLRESLEHPGRTAALITPDRALARRVAAELDRYDIEIDDSGGRPLNATPPGAFLLLLATMVAQDFAPHATLAALKHPLAAGGISPGLFRHHVRALERIALRGPRPAQGIAGLLAACPDHADLRLWLTALDQVAAPFATALAGGPTDLRDLMDRHLAFAEALAADAEGPGADRLWSGDAGQAAQTFMADLRGAADAMAPLAGHHYPGLLGALMEGIAVRPSHGRHPRLFIWGPLEARLQHADLVILGGLNEGVWPPEPAADPWMSRPMRAKFGLPAPERRIGLSAHDFVQAFCAPRVALTRAVRSEGTPTVPSRWLQRLDTVLRACGRDEGWPRTPWLAWAAAQDRPDRVVPTAAPAPCPPWTARPRELSVTKIETWMRDPYGLYAQEILKLHKLEPIDADPGASDYGSLVHKALHTFLSRYPSGPLPKQARVLLRDAGRAAFATEAAHPGLMAFWWPRFERIADWFVETERARRSTLRHAYSEIGGRLALSGLVAPFTVTARADRVDVLTDGTLGLIDYKTGQPPPPAQVEAGFAPQLPLEAAIAQAGGFRDIAAAPVSALAFWHLGGNDEGGREKKAGTQAPADLAAQALAGLWNLVAVFDDEATPYRARPHPEHAPRYSDYLHLARVREWSSDDGDES